MKRGWAVLTASSAPLTARHARLMDASQASSAATEGGAARLVADASPALQLAPVGPSSCSMEAAGAAGAAAAAGTAGAAAGALGAASKSTMPSTWSTLPTTRPSAIMRAATASARAAASALSPSPRRAASVARLTLR